jgi:phosphomevalonate kinase
MKNRIEGVTSPQESEKELSDYMLEKNNFEISNDPLESKFDILQFLAGLESVSKKEIAEFQENRLLSRYRNVFERIKEADKMILVAIDKLSDDQIIKLNKLSKEIEENGKSIVGIHKARTRLAVLFQLTEDKKYKLQED